MSSKEGILLNLKKFKKKIDCSRDIGQMKGVSALLKSWIIKSIVLIFFYIPWCVVSIPEAYGITGGPCWEDEEGIRITQEGWLCLFKLICSRGRMDGWEMGCNTRDHASVLVAQSCSGLCAKQCGHLDCCFLCRRSTWHGRISSSESKWHCL